MEELEKLTTIADECILVGAPRIIKKNAGYLANGVNRIVENYDSTDFDDVSLMADIELCRENCDEIIEAARLCKETLKKLYKELTQK